MSIKLRLLLSNPGKLRLDSILQGVVEKCPNIQRVELEALARPLTAAEMQEAAAEAQAMLQTLSERVMASGGKLVADSGRD